MARDRLQPLAGRADDQRQRDQRHHRPGGEERAAEDDALGGAAEEAERGAGEDHEPKIARTIDGVPAIISTADSTTRASATGRPYSVSQTAIATPSGSAIAMPSAATSSVPISGSRKPPVFALVEAGRRAGR